MDAESARNFLARLRPAFAESCPDGSEAESRDVAVVEAQYRAIAAGDMVSLRAGWEEGIEFENLGPPELPWVGRWRGREEVAAAVVRNFAMLDGQRPEVLCVVAGGGRVVVMGRESGVVKATGRRYETHWVQFFTVRGGKVAALTQVFDSGPLLAAMKCEGG